MRRDALGDEVPGRLVKIKKVKLIPATRGLDRFEFDEPIESRIEGVDDDGAACSIPEAGVVTVGVLNADFTDWLFSLGESTWRAADTRLTQGYGGPILASSSRGSKLGLSEETVTLLERLLVARLERTVQVAFNPHEQNVIDSGTPRCRDVEAGACFQYSLSSLRGPDSTGQLQLTIDEQRLTVTTDEQRNLFKVSGEIRFTFDFSIRHKYFVARGPAEFAQLCNQPAVSHPGSYSFDLSGPIRRHKN